jgi:hypothetical protein
LTQTWSAWFFVKTVHIQESSRCIKRIASSLARKECQRENRGTTKTEKQIEMRKTQSRIFLSISDMPTQIEVVTPAESSESESQNIIYDFRVDIQTLITTPRLRWHSKIFENHCDEIDRVFGSAGQFF